MRLVQTPSLLLLTFWLSSVRADDDWKCKASLGGHNYDFSSLGGERVLHRDRETPPTKMVDKLTFDLCKPLPESSEGAEGDRCPAGTYACFTTVNQRSGESDRIVTVVPVATSSTLKPAVNKVSNGKISILLHGPGWPSSSPIDQALNVTLECTQSDEDPVLVDHSDSTTWVTWKNKAACETANDPDKPPSESHPAKTGNGVGWFFGLLLLCFVVYFAGGAWYNYNNYGASGYDLVPHRDFWRDVPHLAKDVVGHLFSSVRGNQRSSRGGYVSV